MTIIDFTAQMAPIGMVGLAFLIAAGAAIGHSMDDSERQKMRNSAQRVGAWWLGRGASGSPRNASLARAASR